MLQSTHTVKMWVVKNNITYNKYFNEEIIYRNKLK